LPNPKWIDHSQRHGGVRPCGHPLESRPWRALEYSRGNDGLVTLKRQCDVTIRLTLCLCARATQCSSVAVHCSCVYSMRLLGASGFAMSELKTADLDLGFGVLGETWALDPNDTES